MMNTAKVMNIVVGLLKSTKKKKDFKNMFKAWPKRSCRGEDIITKES